MVVFGALCALGTAGSVAAQPNVSLSVGINAPGVYGRVNIGDVPPPALVMAQPVIIAPPQVRYDRRPIYLYVSPFEQQNWGRYCGRYAACGQPVYFVRDDWVRQRYVQEHPDWGHRHDDGRGRGPEHGRDFDRGDHGDHGEHRGGDRDRGHDRHD